ncbi:trypsin-like serine protease [Nannocystis sp. SCPEA4]|uniref:S1 family peptidase n=1 Tax=Nannocystis sp. SCPEA4 TaxID=2996787 RepID=UPI0022722B80|nr:trypsin-like serine protease [Nannocystis sp. SCPEA4]MCY1053598.1 trypsin-like serine protease [Nannocystis sp. SCPEA4]
MRPPAYISAAFVALSFATPAAADEPPDELAFPVEPTEIYGGEDTVACGWPTTVSMLGQCTGTLVHPEVVIFAAHCGTGYNAVMLGETINGPKRQVPTEFCRTFPGGQPGNGQDFAFCKLSQPQLDIPIVPILMGCETDILQPGQQVTIVGFGNADTGPYGVKREVVTTINSITGNNEADIGGGGKDSCQGDSGGPVFVQLADGSWRVFGITSYGGACGQGGMYSMMHRGMDWFEQESGIDLTPCHNADGTWAPTPACKGFPLDPGAGNGDWGSGCNGGPLGGQSVTCGAAACDEAADKQGPTVNVTTPTDGTVLMAPDMIANVSTNIAVGATDNAGGCGVKEVHLLINGNEVGGVDISDPFEFVNVAFPTGCWKVGAKAIDWVGNEGQAEPVTLCVNQEPPVGTTSTTGDDSEGDSLSGTGEETTESAPTTGSEDPTTGSDTNPGPVTSATGTGGVTSGLDDDKEGCACAAGGGEATGGALMLLGLGLLGRRRRRY